MLRFGQFLFAALLCGLWSYSTIAQAIADQTELLPENEAFAFNAELLPDHKLQVSWIIAQGYYMYRDKIDYRLSGDNALAAPLALPPGKQKQDELFGEVEVYTGTFKMLLPLQHNGSFTLVADGQGCNEPVGVCYPPITHEISFASADGGGISGVPPQGSLSDETVGLERIGNGNGLLAELSGDANKPSPIMQSSSSRIPESAQEQNSSVIGGSEERTSTDEVDSIEQLRDLLSSGIEQPEYLAVDDAFKLSIDQLDSKTLQASFAIAEGYYLYRDKMRFSGSGDAQVDKTSLPEGEIKEDEYFGRTSVLRQSFEFPIRLGRADPEPGRLTLEASYQGCADQGICYPPVTKSFTFELPAIIQKAEAQSAEPPLFKAPKVSNAAAAGSILSLLLGAFAAGLLLTFTPCVLPMIPILSGVIAGQGDRLTRSRGGILALVYVLGTAATYAAMGAVAGATGEQLQAYFQNAWAIGVLAVIFVLMALAMFGLFELQMPASIQSRLQSSTSKMSGSIPLVFILGLVSALIIGACVSPVLISFLGLAVSRADPVLGAQMMFVMSLGMGLPLIMLGFGAGYLLPRAGAWMDKVKYFFGIMLIGVAIYLLGVLPEVPVLLLWGVFLIIVSTYLGATQSLPEGSTGWDRFGKGFGTVLLVWGIVALLGGFYGERDLFKPLPARLFQIGDATGVQQPFEAHLFTQVSSLSELDQQFARAAAEDKRIMIDFYADWCVDCIKMEKSTFQDPSITSILTERYISLQVDVTDPNDADTKAIKKRFGVFGPPAVLFFDSLGQPLDHKNFYGYQNPEQFLSLISN